jgi:DNA-binding HxlR family transcriptional regulator
MKKSKHETKLKTPREDAIKTVKGSSAEVTKQTGPEVEAVVHEMIGRIADKWTMLVLEALEEHGELRFTQLGARVPGISQKMLTQTVRQMERDGLLIRTIHPVIPPRVEYKLTKLGSSLSEAFCGVWQWVEKNRERVDAARVRFDAEAKA